MNEQLWRRAEALFHATLEHAPESRAAFLEAACGGDGELRRQVELLVTQEENAGSFLEHNVLTESAGLTPRTRGSLVGRTLGPYRLLSLIGSGGMGDVYRAHDSRLGREVAIKTLPREFSRDPDRLARFRAEARALASLNHPRIAAIYGLEESDTADCLVLELVEGETLRGPLPVDVALDRIAQVAEALEAAHAKGIVHRDLKPANVKVTPAGGVKVLDFGLAKVIGAGLPSHGMQPALAAPADTMLGRIAGTPGYMSPEQATGRPIDHRTDIWALGCLFYELLTGKKAFEGGSAAETMAAVLGREPEWQALPRETSARIRLLLKQCLDKDPERRPPHIVVIREAIAESRRSRTGSRTATLVAAVAVVFTAIGFAVWVDRPRQAVDRSAWTQLTRFTDSVTQPSLSPDGRMLTFIRGGATFIGFGQIFVKTLPDGDPVQLTHDNLRKMSPVFTPDGSSIAYTILDEGWNWNTWTVPVKGGEPRPFLSNASGLQWIGPHQLLYSARKMGVHMGLSTSDDSGRGARDIYVPSDEPAMAHRSYLSPDRKSVLLVEMDQDHLWLPCRVVPLDGSSTGHTVGPPGGCTFGAWSPDGKWMYLTVNAGGADHIWRQRFPDGAPEQVTSGPTEEQGIAMAADGRSLIASVALANSSIWIHDAAGDRQISVEGNAALPRFTPDGGRLCYLTVREATLEFTFYRDPGDLRVVDLKTGRSEAVAPGTQVLDYDISTDSRNVVIGTADRGLWLAPLDRSSDAHRIPGVTGAHPRFATGGDIFFRQTEGNSTYVYRVHADGSGLRKAIDRPILIAGEVSPDGHSIVGWAPGDGGTDNPVYQVFPLEGGNPILLGPFMRMSWTRDGRAVLFSGPGSFLVPVPPGRVLPELPKQGMRSLEEIAGLPGAKRVDTEGVVPGSVVAGPTPGVYAYYRGAIQRNLYRIPLP